jgi:hypothetical protein
MTTTNDERDAQSESLIPNLLRKVFGAKVDDPAAKTEIRKWVGGKYNDVNRAYDALVDKVRASNPTHTVAEVGVRVLETDQGRALYAELSALARLLDYYAA